MAFWKIHVSQILYTNLTDFSKERTGKYSEIIYHSKHLSTVSLINENDQLVTNHLTLTCLLLRGGIAFAQPKSSNKAFHKERLQSITISGTNLSPQLTWKFDLLQKDTTTLRGSSTIFGFFLWAHTGRLESWFRVKITRKGTRFHFLTILYCSRIASLLICLFHVFSESGRKFTLMTQLMTGRETVKNNKTKCYSFLS